MQEKCLLNLITPLNKIIKQNDNLTHLHLNME